MALDQCGVLLTPLTGPEQGKQIAMQILKWLNCQTYRLVIEHQPPCNKQKPVRGRHRYLQSSSRETFSGHAHAAAACEVMNDSDLSPLSQIEWGAQ